IIGEPVDARTLNPVLSSDRYSIEAAFVSWESLVRPDAKTGNTELRLAERFDVSPDGKTLTFVLRDGLRWSDGSPFSGDDFIFTVEAILRSPTSIRKAAVQDILGARDYGTGKAESIAGISSADRTITIRLGQPFCPAVLSIGSLGIIPRSVFGKYMDPKDAGR